MPGGFPSSEDSCLSSGNLAQFNVKLDGYYNPDFYSRVGSGYSVFLGVST
ncbi:hypothetical protein E5S67_04357 [Microcoleus sp. IPMA8]|uniref:Uncharacterized protein n=1 Tax=Microcoleus asticus IPMA8 TaxID=2563858 RepID=A0ABX2D1T2_9CYAN|nr:hypothetical protein [Microcoleus asticus IPMA8]